MKPFSWIYKNFRASTFDEDGVFSLSHIYDQLEKENLLEIFFYDGIPAKQWFTSLEKSMHDMVFAAFSDDNTLLAFSRVNNITGLSGLMHFCFFEAGRDMALDIAADFHDDMARGGFKALMGLTPKPFRHAIKFAESAGYERLGSLPSACYMARYDKYVDGIITVKPLTLGA